MKSLGSQYEYFFVSLVHFSYVVIFLNERKSMANASAYPKEESSQCCLARNVLRFLLFLYFTTPHTRLTTITHESQRLTKAALTLALILKRGRSTYLTKLERKKGRLAKARRNGSSSSQQVKFYVGFACLSDKDHM
jgi:hypothetical protein